MKTIFLLNCKVLLFCFLFTSALSAQKFGFSAHVGLGVSQIGGDFLSGFNNLSYQIGVNAPYKINNRFKWVTGFSFRNSGSNKNGEKTPLVGNRIQIEMLLRSVSISGLLQINFTETWEGGYRNYVRFGPAFNYLVSTDLRSVSSKEVAEIKPLFKRSFYNFQAAFGKIISDKHSLEICFSYALTSIKKAPKNMADLYPYEILINFEYNLFQ